MKNAYPNPKFKVQIFILKTSRLSFVFTHKSKVTYYFLLTVYVCMLWTVCLGKDYVGGNLVVSVDFFHLVGGRGGGLYSSQVWMMSSQAHDVIIPVSEGWGYCDLSS